METNEIKVSATNPTTGIKIGSDEAPVKIIEFLNLRCPYCRQWYDEKNEWLNEYVNEGKIQRVIKLFNKEKPSLAKGNVMHQYVPTTGGQETLAALDKIYASQDTWGDLVEHREIEVYAEEILGLTKNNNTEQRDAIIAEAEAANVFFIPTMIVGEHVFDQKISQAELKNLLEL